MDDLTERRDKIAKKIAEERAALHAAFVTLEPPLRRVEKGIQIVGSIRHYWKPISMGLSVLSLLLFFHKLFSSRKKKIARPVEEFPDKQKGLFLWIGRAWRAYRWYVKIRGWLA